MNWYDFYNKTNNVINYLSGAGTICEIKTSTMMLPKLIVRQWAVKQIAELPNIHINNEINEEVEEIVLKDIKQLVSNLLAYGIVFVVPYLNDYEEFEYNVIFNDYDYFEKSGRLQLLKYKRDEKVFTNGKIETKTVHHNHFMKDNVYFYEQYYQSNNMKIYLNGNDGLIPISNDVMLPFVIKLKINADNLGVPIYANAVELINDADNTYTEMLNVLELQRPVVAMPSNLVPDQRNQKDITTLSSYSRIFAMIPGVDKEDMELKYFGGQYEPSPYIKTLDYILNEISKQCGFGHKYLSYEKESGLKTATEVTSNQNDLFVNQLMLNQDFQKAIELLTSRYLYITNKQDSNILTDLTYIDVVFKDSVFNNETDYINQLKYDVMNDNINKEFYLSKVYPEEEVSLIINNEEQA